MGKMTYEVFLYALSEIWFMWPIAIILEMFVVGGLAKKLAFRLVTPGKDNPTLILLAICSMIVCLMCPIMSAIATLLIKHAYVDFLPVWLETTVKNFPMALCWQIFYGGPFVRFLFRFIFKKQLAEANTEK